MAIGIKIIWSGNRLLPKAENIVRVDYGQNIGDTSIVESRDKIQIPNDSNSYKNFCYRWYPYLKF